MDTTSAILHTCTYGFGETNQHCMVGDGDEMGREGRPFMADAEKERE